MSAEHPALPMRHAKGDIPERRPSDMPAKTTWVVLHATEVNGAHRGRASPAPTRGPVPRFAGIGPKIQVPKAVAERIGLRVDLPSPGNGLGFLDRGPGVLPVAAMADPSVGATQESIRGLLAVATPTKKLVFSLPKRVREHLGLAKRDLVAWVSPEGAPKGRPVLLVRSAFPDLVSLPPGLGEALPASQRG